MASLPDQYPVFEANQVLTSSHLNDVFAYLDQNQRLTRAQLIGIGIVCGLDIQLAGGTITLTKGCGVTTQGYLVLGSEDVNLVASRPYTLPAEIAYPNFKPDGIQIPMWELFEAGEPDTTPLTTTPGFLDDKGVVLFLELNKQALRNCSPNNCDDKGSQVIVTVRRLLVARADLDDLLAAAANLDSGLTEQDLLDTLSQRLHLADLRPRRFDVPNLPGSYPVSTNDIYLGFLDMLRRDDLVAATAQALHAAYEAFKPLLVRQFPSDPFTDLEDKFGFLDHAPTDTDQVHFLPYYADLFDDLLRGYDEFRWAALELMCACCPDEQLFPRHLALGLLHPESVSQPNLYRRGFLASPAVGGCETRSAEVRQLFARLVAMCENFTNQPPLPAADPTQTVDPQIRITPSLRRHGQTDLGDQAIPYYYAQPKGTPIHSLWNPNLTRRHRTNHNLGYHADSYLPAAPDFITRPLDYSLGGHDFLRIEGHLGKDYQAVLDSLLAMKSEQRLPIDVIALRTGPYDASQPVDLDQEAARFQDLLALYASLRGELRTQLAEGIMQLYDRPIAVIKNLPLAAGAPQLTLLQNYAPQFRFKANTIGAWYEHYLDQLQGESYIDVNQNAINSTALMYLYCGLFNGTVRPEEAAFPHVVAIYYMSRLAEALTPTLDELAYAEFENKYEDLLALIRYFRSDIVHDVSQDLQTFLPKAAFLDQCESILMGCKLGGIQALREQYQARVEELRRMQFLSNFLQKEPAIEHRAGVPLGGTFVVVCHGEIDTTPPGKRPGGRFDFGGRRDIRDLDRLNATARNVYDNMILTKAAGAGISKYDLSAFTRYLATNQTITKGGDALQLADVITHLEKARSANTGAATAKLVKAAVATQTAKKIVDEDNPRKAAAADVSASNQFHLLSDKAQTAHAVGVTKTDYLVRATSNIMFDKSIPALTVHIGDHPADGNELDRDSARRAVEKLRANPEFIDNRNLHKVLDMIDTVLQPSQPTVVPPADKDDPASDIIQQAVDGLLPGTVIADFFLPYRLSSLVPAMQYTLPRVPATYSVKVGCTGPNNTAAIDVQAKGGVPPYEVALDEGDYQRLTGPVQVAVGEHAIQLRDAVGTEAVTHDFTVPPPITIGDPAFTCKDDKYTAKAAISGGVPPYQVDGKPAPDATIITAATPSGSEVVATVKDSRGCSAVAKFQHACPKPCTLPCKGIALNRNYRFVLPEPDPKSGFGSRDFELKAVKFIVFADKNKPIDLTEKIKPLVMLNDPNSSAEKFRDAVQKWLEAINQLIAKTPELADGKAQWLTLDYKSLGINRLGVLSIEHFECLAFEIKLAAALSYTNSQLVAAKPLPNQKTTIEATYKPDGMVLQAGKLRLRVPASDGTTTDQCKGSKPTRLCPLKPEFTAAIKGPGKGRVGQALTFTATSSAKRAQFLWEAQEGLPGIVSGAKFTTTFNTAGTKLISLSAVNAKGCSVAAVIQISVQGGSSPDRKQPTDIFVGDRDNQGKVVKEPAKKPAKKLASKTTAKTGKPVVLKVGKPKATKQAIAKGEVINKPVIVNEARKKPAAKRKNVKQTVVKGKIVKPAGADRVVLGKPVVKRKTSKTPTAKRKTVKSKATKQLRATGVANKPVMAVRKTRKTRK